MNPYISSNEKPRIDRSNFLLIEIGSLACSVICFSAFLYLCLLFERFGSFGSTGTIEDMIYDQYRAYAGRAFLVFSVAWLAALALGFTSIALGGSSKLRSFLVLLPVFILVAGASYLL